MRKPAQVGIAWFVATIVAVTIAAAAVSSVRSVVTDVPTALGIAAIRALAIATDEPKIDGGDISALESPRTSTTVSTVESEIPSQTTTTTTVAVTTTTQQVDTGTSQAESTGSSLRSESASPSPPAQPRTGSRTAAEPPPASATTPTTTPPPAPAPAPTATTTTTPTPTTPTTTTTTTSTPTPTTIPTPPSPNAYTRVLDTEGGSFTVRVEGTAVLFARATTSTTTETVWRFDLLNGGPAMVDVRFTSLDNQVSSIRVIVTVTNGVLDILRQPS